jgi:hypothetical protein
MSRAALITLLTCAVSCSGTTGTLVTLGKSQPDASRIDTPASDGGVHGPVRAASKAWQIQLSGALDTSADVPWYEVDAFDTDESDIAALHARGRTVSCYVSVGTDEPWRSDSGKFPALAVGNALADFSREHWVDVRDPDVRAINQNRIVLAASRGCDAVELSNLQAHTADSGFPLTVADDLSYARLLIAAAHAAGLSAGASVSGDMVSSLGSELDWGLTEECLAYDTCSAWAPLAEAGKTVFMIEYGSATDAPVLCPKAAALGFSLVIKRSSLDAFRVGCEGGVARP